MFGFASGGRGKQGAQGPQGAQGIQGQQGVQGVQGPAGTNATPFQSARVTTAADGSYTWDYPTPYAGGVVPHVNAIAEGPNPAAGALVNVQLEGAPTNTQAKFRVTRSNRATVALLGIDLLSLPTNPGATVLHVFAKAP